MTFHALHVSSLWGHDWALVVGIAGGRVAYEPVSRWLYSLRLLLGVVKIEVLWRTGERP